MKGFLATLKGKIILGILGALVVTGGVVAAVALTSSEEVYRSIKVDELIGQTVVIDEDNNVQDVYKGMNLEPGDMIEVKSDSSLVLLMDADKYMFADAGTKFKVEASGNSEKATTKTKIVLEEGSVLCRLDSKLSDEEIFEVETPNSVMSVRGTIFKMSIYRDENGENYVKVDVLEGAVKVDLYKESGEKADEEGLIEAGQAATVHSNTQISEFVIGESNITYDDFSGPMAEFVVETVDTGRAICIGESLFKHYTGLETHPETENIIKEATCSEEGQKEIYCSTCDAVIRVEPIEVEEHTPGEWEPYTEGTCSEKATEAIKCIDCNEVIETRELEYGDHSYGEWEVTTAPTCTEAGIETCKCNGCDAKETRTIEATGHSYGEWEVTTKATCEGTGVETRTCNDCDAKETRSIASKGHSYGEWKETTAATCEETGVETRICSGCKKTETQSIAATGHNYGKWNVITAASCETTGEQTRTCSGCKKTETQSIAATGHIYGGWEITTAAACETTGEQVHSCGVCGETETQTIEALGHDYPTHTASDWHNFDGCDKDAGTVDVFSYQNCTRCGLEEIYRETATMTKYDEQYQQPTGFTCPCGYVY